MTSHEEGDEKQRRNGFGIAVIGFAAILGFYLLIEHTAHLFGALPYVLLLTCPLMHLLMHHGRHDHGREGSKQDRQ